MEEIKTEHGIFTEITDRDGNVVETAEEHYQWVLKNRNQPQDTEPNEIDILKENKQLWDTVQFLLKGSGYIPTETE